MIKDNLHQINEHIASICKQLGRNPDDVTLVGVTKYSTVEQMRQAIEAGLVHIGENRVADAELKFKELYGLNTRIVRHMIGHLQSNKVLKAVENFDLIQSVDSLKLAQEIQKKAQQLDKTVDILIQINISGETQKFGIDQTNAQQMLNEIANLSRIKVCGLMTMAPFVEDEKILRTCFRGLKQIFDQFKEMNFDSKRVEMKYLSMGMSGDYPIALEEGANMVRIGSAIFK